VTTTRFPAHVRCLRRGTITVALSLMISACGAHNTLRWEDTTGGTASTMVERKIGTTGTYQLLGIVPPGVTELKDAAGGPPGTVYCYRVRAIDSKGQASSSYSKEVCKQK
jgi:hypothetical protein